MSFRAKLVDLTTQDTYPTTPQLSEEFEGQVTVFNQCAAALAYVYVSFDGTTANEAQLRPNAPSAAIAFVAKRKKCWIRREAGVFAGALQAQVILEGT